VSELGYDDEIAERFPAIARLTDESGNEFRVDGGQGMFSVAAEKGPDANTAVFAAPEAIEPGKKRRFRLEIPLEASPSLLTEDLDTASDDELPNEPVGEPFVFEFEVPVRPVPVVRVDQEVKANGLTLTLDRIVNFPGRPHAVICMTPPDDEHWWGPRVKKSGLNWSEPADGYLESTPIGNGCVIATFSSEASSYSSLTVTKVEGFPRNRSVDGPEDIKTIPGPWRFDFEVPER
jgi:hypothetical protein